jgi:GH24 family phage-related lysozyme (muramidase)
MKVSNKGLEIIKKYGIAKLKAYKKQRDWYIGYNHKGAQKGDICTEEEAEEFLKEDLEQYENVLIPVEQDLNQNQFDALVSLMYSTGIVDFKQSLLYKKVCLKSSDLSIPAEFVKLNKVAGKDNLQVTKRRLEEGLLYIS